MSERTAVVRGAWLLALALNVGCSQSPVSRPELGSLAYRADSGVLRKGDSGVLATAADSAAGGSTEGGADGGMGSSNGGVDGGADGGMGLDASAGECTGDIICDDFESNSLGAAPANWQVVVDPPDAGTVSVDDTHTFSGARAVHFNLPVASPGAYSTPHVQILGQISPPTNEFFGRIMVWINPSNPTGHHWNLIEGWGYTPGNTSHGLSDQEMYEYGGVCNPNGSLGAAYLNATTDCCQQSNQPVPVSYWACVEWQFDGVNSEYHFWLDGQAIDALTVTASPTQCGGVWNAPAFERVDLGWGSGGPNAAETQDMWIDDVAIDSTRIGCPAPTMGTH